MIIHLLTVDDDEAVRDLIKESFAGETGYRISGIDSGRKALASIGKAPPDLVLLDWKLPDMTGQDVCRALRADAHTAGIAIIMLTSIDNLSTKVESLDAGMDDYLTKPFEILELKARIKAVLRRKVPWLVPSRILEFKGVVIDPASYKVHVHGKDAGLTKVEFEILHLLAVNADRSVSRAYLESRVLDLDLARASRSLDVHLSHIREKLGQKESRRLETMRGVGYIFSGDNTGA